jgi:hypothetical protein
MDFKHRKITPLWPQANVECERFMKIIGKSIRASHVHHTNWKQDMYALKKIQIYTTWDNGWNSCTIVLHIKIPMVGKQKKSKKDIYARENDRKSKQKMKECDDKRSNARKTEVKKGDSKVEQTKYTHNSLQP